MRRFRCFTRHRGHFAAAALSLSFALGACATTGAGSAPTQSAVAQVRADVDIVDAGDLYSTLDLASEPSAWEALRAAGYDEAQIRDIFAHANEQGWPPTLAQFDERIANPHIVRAYAAQRVASFGEPGHRFHLVRLPEALNRHQPPGWRPERDIYLVFGEQGLADK